MHGEDRVLTAHRHVSDDQVARVVARWWQRMQFDWQRFIVGASAAFHLGVAVPLAFAPIDQILNAGTAPVFAIANRYVWATAFLIAGLASTALLRRQTAVVQMAWWFTAMPLGAMWWIAFCLAVLQGRGSAIGVVVWLTLYGLFAVAGIRIALGRR